MILSKKILSVILCIAFIIPMFAFAGTTVNATNGDAAHTVITASSFTGGGFGFADYSGEVAGVAFDGVLASSYSYQPTFYFTQAAVDAIAAYASANDVDMLVIHSNATLYNNGFVVAGSWTSGGGTWSTTEIAVANLTASTSFWSQSEGATTIYMWFELYKEPIIPARVFTGGGFSFADYSGTLGGVAFDGIRALSGSYQPTFYFTQDGVDRINAYAAANGYSTLRIHSWAILYDNGFVVNGNWTGGGGSWYTTDIAVSAISTSTSFWSQSQGSTEVYMWFEFLPQDPIRMDSFYGGNSPTGYSFSNYSGTVDGVTFSGVTCSTYLGNQERFYLTSSGKQRIRDYAALYGYNTLVMHIYAQQNDNSFVVNACHKPGNEWTTEYVAISMLDTLSFYTENTSGTPMIYMWFEFSTDLIISGTFFAANGDYYTAGTDTIDGYTGFMVSNSRSSGNFYLSSEGQSAIADYANANGYFIRLHVYSDQNDNGFIFGDRYTSRNVWTVFDIHPDDISSRFHCQGTSRNAVRMWFEFIAEPDFSYAWFTPGDGFAPTNYSGKAQLISGSLVGDTFDGVYAGSNGVYQPKLYFSSYGVNKLNALASAHGYNVLKLHVFCACEDASFAIKNGLSGASEIDKWLSKDEWITVELPIANITTGTYLWETTSTGPVRFFMWAELSAGYTLSFDMMGHGSAIASQTVTPGGLAARPADPSETGYTFVNWYKESDCTNVWDFASDMVSDTTVVYAKWTANDYTVTYDANGGAGAPANGSYTYGNVYTISAAPSTAAAYTVTFDYNGGSVSPNVATLSFDRAFVCWYTNSSGAGGTAYDPSDSYTAAAGLDLYAIWGNATIAGLPVPSRAGYTFSGWYVGNTEYSNGDTLTGSITLIAEWDAIPLYLSRRLVLDSGVNIKFGVSSDWFGTTYDRSRAILTVTFTNSDGSGTEETVLRAADAVLVDGEYVFNFDRINPAHFGVTMSATIKAPLIGDTVTPESEWTSYTISDYSVARYCYNIMKAYKNGVSGYTVEQAKLCAAIIRYGQASEPYALDRHGIDPVVSVTDRFAAIKAADSDGLLKPDYSDYITDATEKANDARILDNSVTLEGFKWKSAALELDSKVKVKINYTYTGSENYVLKVSYNDASDVVHTVTLGALHSGVGSVYFDGLNPSEFGTKLRFAVYDGENVLKSSVLQYSVNSYITRVSGSSSSDSLIRNLLSAVNEYGDASVNYIASLSA